PRATEPSSRPPPPAPPPALRSRGAVRPHRTGRRRASRRAHALRRASFPSSASRAYQPPSPAGRMVFGRRAPPAVNRVLLAARGDRDQSQIPGTEIFWKRCGEAVVLGG